MKQKINIMFANIKNFQKDQLIFKALFENFNIKIVDEFNEADVIFELAWRNDYSLLNKAIKEDKKIIFITLPEDLTLKRTFFNLVEVLVGRFTGFLDGNYKKEIKYKIMDKLDSIIPYWITNIKTFYFDRGHLEIVKKIRDKKIKNCYAIIQNNIHGKNIFILPLAISQYYGVLSSLLKKPYKKGLSKKKKRFCAFTVTSNSCRERIKFFKELSKYKKVDSYGKTLNNMGNELQKINYTDIPKVFRNKKYKFYICFDNNSTEEFISERLIIGMQSNTIPIYRGSPNIGKYFNTKSFINVGDFENFNEVIEKIKKIDEDDELYEKVLKEPWFKNNKIPDSIKNKEKELIEFYKKIFYS